MLSRIISNVVAHYDGKENVYPRKERPENKIDGAAALTMALGRHMTFEKPLDLDEFLASPNLGVLLEVPSMDSAVGRLSRFIREQRSPRVVRRWRRL